MEFWLGCAIWGYKDWVGDLFPPGSRAADFLHLYSRRFTAVEGNTTFYSIPDAETVRRWAAATPEGFKFCPKLSKTLTHQGLLAPTIAETIAFLERMQGLGDRLGVVFAQLPPSYSPDAFDDLQTFLAAMPRDQVNLAVEVRHLNWFEAEPNERLNQLLTSLGVGRVLLDTRPIYTCPDDPQIASERRKPKVPLQPVSTAPFNLVRFISHPESQYNQPFLQEWSQQIGQWLQQNQQVYFFVHCPVEQRSPGTARHFQHLLEQEPVPVPSLPWDRLETNSPLVTQLSLF
ncbi:DUF72 domain-containing protein [Leptolyngbya sp. NK1-12]|uniref:DUF72 domain-containing protein n=1 Tax=Leptolyngbya sp. NK1-12 TaxID=2547451 RepID=A0AA96WFB7_9CYAN|nr:DUF72 domain-containing protein [Leptolyngbya sp. NK1-12]WNZ24338.1 DUF72 domain-containing protein [Leptolyngbya sp. NK1-12]